MRLMPFTVEPNARPIQKIHIMGIQFVWLFNILLLFPSVAESGMYPWMGTRNSETSLVNRIEVPREYQRVKVTSGSFGDWLRHLPLKQEGSAVYLYNGKRKSNQYAHVAVVDIDTGRADLQQCADAIIRLRAEYLFFKKDVDEIHFNFTSGQSALFSKWADRFRPVVSGNKVIWVQKAAADASYHSFRQYLNTVFTFAGSYSLSNELEPVLNIQDMTIGDVFIKGGFPGHAVMVVDMAYHIKTGKKLFLLAQSYMPAQDIHILKNPSDTALSPWYDIDFGSVLYTPEWTFSNQELKRFPQ